MSNRINNRIKRIADLNDRFRMQMMMPLFFESEIVPGKVLLTAGISAMTAVDNLEILFKVRDFNDFTEDNYLYKGLHGERDFGAFDHNDKRIFWKIDYYAPDMMHGSEDPADPAQTMRVLTIMLANEY